jgi:hypothetical protein
MTEAEWLACPDPMRMLEFLRTQRTRTTSDRKMRLFAVACCRRVWDLLGEPSRHALEVLERHLDGAAADEELWSAIRDAEQDWFGQWEFYPPTDAARAALTFRNTIPLVAALRTAEEVAEGVRCEAAASIGPALGWWPPPQMPDPAILQMRVAVGDRTLTAERAAQCQLLRDIFHGPCRAIHFQSRWRTDAVLSIASAIYRDRQFERLPVLADALEYAGCSEPELLGHLRSPGVHVRGCWAVDLLLKKS